MYLQNKQIATNEVKTAIEIPVIFGQDLKQDTKAIKQIIKNALSDKLLLEEEIVLEIYEQLNSYIRIYQKTDLQKLDKPIIKFLAKLLQDKDVIFMRNFEEERLAALPDNEYVRKNYEIAKARGFKVNYRSKEIPELTAYFKNYLKNVKQLVKEELQENYMNYYPTLRNYLKLIAEKYTQPL